MDDPRYVRYISWQNSNIPLKRQPKLFKLVSSKAQRLFKKYLEPRPEKRPANLSDLFRYLEDRWMSKGMEKSNETLKEDEGLCPSMYSFHSSPEEKNKLLHNLTQYGLETTVDRVAKKNRIREWIQNSVIEEETNEDIEDDEETDENLRIQDSQNGPVRERESNTERKIKEIKNRNRRKSHRHHQSKKEAPYKAPVDPRKPLESQQRTARDHNSPASGNNVSEVKNGQGSWYKIPNSLTSSESVISSESSLTIKHNINVQIPQT